MKKIIALFLAVIMCLGVLALPASAFTYRDDFPNTHRNTGKNLADFIAVAKTQIGYTELSTSTGKPLGINDDGGYTKYGAWFGAPTVAWCAFFVTWCANQAGISSSVIPRFGNCEALTDWYKGRDRYLYASSSMPRTGDLIFYNWSGGRIASHIGIVTGVSGNNIYTVEGNTGSSHGYRCEAKVRTRGAYYIIGYARPDYNDAETYIGSFSFAEYAARKYKAYQKYGSSFGSSKYSGTSTLAVITGKAEEITGKSATLTGKIDNFTSHSVAYAGFYFGTDKNNLTIYGDYYGTTKSSFTFSMDISKRYGELKPDTEYYYCAYASINGKAYKGPVHKLKTVDDRPQLIALSDENLSMAQGETYEILSAVLPLEAGEAKIKWSSSDEYIVTVKDGMLTGKNPGYSVITARSDYGDVEATCDVVVTLAPVGEVNTEIASDGKIKITWEKNESLDVFGYEIYRSESPSSGFEKIGKVSDLENEFTDKKVKNGKYYYYKIKTVGAFEDFDSELSASSSIKAVPATPEISSIKQSGTSFTLTWNEIKGADEYRVYRSLLPEKGYSLIGTVSDTEFTDNDIYFGRKYYYKIAASKDGILSGFSENESKTAGEISFEPDPLMDMILN